MIITLLKIQDTIDKINIRKFSLKIALKKKKTLNACSGSVQGEYCWEKLVTGHSQGLTMAYTMAYTIAYPMGLFLLLVGGISCW